MNLFDGALHDGAVILDAYARFVTTAIGMLVFPYAAIAPGKTASQQSESQPSSRSRHSGIVKIVIALLVGAVLGRRLFARRRALR